MRRTQKEIESDYRICKTYMEEHPDICTIKELSSAVGLSPKQVRTSMINHPRVFNKILKGMECAKAQKQAQKELEKEAQRKAKQEALEAKRKDKQKAEADAKRKAEKDTNASVKKSKIGSFVIDASITGIPGIIDTLGKICATKSKIILTSITIKELEKMQKFHDTDGNDARKILSMAAGDYDNFQCVLIDETVGCADDCIIRYCTANKNDVTLLTSDKTMELKARTYGVRTFFCKQNKSFPATFGVGTHKLYVAKKICNKLLVYDFGNARKSVRVVSGGIEYNSGTVELKLGDDVFIATQKEGYVTFAHYRMTSVSAENNCSLIFSRRLYESSEIDDLPEASYKSFMCAFKRKVDF